MHERFLLPPGPSSSVGQHMGSVVDVKSYELNEGQAAIFNLMADQMAIPTEFMESNERRRGSAIRASVGLWDIHNGAMWGRTLARFDSGIEGRMQSEERPHRRLPRWSEATEEERNAPIVPPKEPTIIAPHDEASARRLDPGPSVTQTKRSDEN